MPVTKIVVPTGHLATSPLVPESFRRGVEAGPDYLVADAGSADMGPAPLGADKPSSYVRHQRHDLEHMLLAARDLDIPMIIGSAADNGTDKSVDLFVDLIRDIARQHGLAPFTLTAIYSQQPLEQVRSWVTDGPGLVGLNGRPDAATEVIDRTEVVVAVMGVEPIVTALEAGADVIICGRSSDSAIFAAPLLFEGHGPADAYLAGKALECASFAAEPFAGKETIMGTISEAGVDITAMAEHQSCTPLSVAAHTMYERVDPFREYVPGGHVDLTECRYEQIDAKTTRVTGQRFVADTYRVKLEGAGAVSERAIAMMGIRDPYTIEHIDRVVELCREKTESVFGPIGSDYDLHYHLFGKNAVMGDRDPGPTHQPHELGVVVDVAAADGLYAEEICSVASRALFYVRLPQVKGTAGTAAIFIDEILRPGPIYDWTLCHVVDVDDPHTLFRTVTTTIEEVTHATAG